MFWFSRGKKLSLFRGYSYDPFDVSVAVHRVIVRRYGENSIFGIRFFMRLQPLPFISVKVGRCNEERGMQGVFKIKHARLRGEFNVVDSSVYYGVREQFQEEAEKFFEAIQEELDTKSVYRGKAFTLNREFLDLDSISEEAIVFTPKTENFLNSQVWAIIEKPELCAEMKIYPQRKILFHGPYGSGKTLAMPLTAKKAVNNGWTVIYMPPTDKRNAAMMDIGLQIARKYQPAVFLMEDIDHEQRSGDPFFFRQVLTNMDGVVSKGAKVIIVMTTNFVEKIEGGLLRPRRVDQMVEFEKFREKETRELVQKLIPRDRLSSDIDWGRIYRASCVYPAAFISGMAKSAALQAVGMGSKMVTEDMLVEAAENLRFQFEACEKALHTGQYH